MAYRRITVQIKGDPSDNDRLYLHDFIYQLEAIRYSLAHFESEIVGAGSSSLQYRLVDLTYKSPATVVWEMIPDPKGPDVSALVADRYIGTIKHIESGAIPETISSDLLESFKRIGPPIPRGQKKKTTERHLSLVSIATEGDKVDVTESLEPKIEKIVGPDELMHGSVTGTLELINIHANANTFRIYPIVGPKKVDCHFKREQLDKAIAAINRYIEVRGTLRYKRRDKFPYAVDALEIEIYPKKEELPSIFDLRGIAPDATGDMSSEDFVRKLRDAW